MKRLALVPLLLSAALIPAAHATVATVSADAHVCSTLPSTNFGSRSNLEVSSNCTAYLSFGLNLPNGTTSAQVSKATLYVYVNRVYTTGTLSLAALTGGFTESSVTYNSKPNAGSSLTTTPVTAGGAYVALDLTSTVQAWVSGTANDGVALTSTGDALLDSKENDLTGHAAYLDITLANQGATGPAGAGFVNGSTSGQLYVTTTSGAPGSPVTTLPTTAIPAFSGDVSNTAGSGALTIASGAVTGAKIASGTITSTNLAANSVTRAAILNGTITGADIASATITSSNLANAAVTNAVIDTSAVTTASIANNAVTIAKLPAGATSATYLRGDGTWATPSSSGSSAVIPFVAIGRNNSVSTNATYYLNPGAATTNTVFTGSTAAYAPQNCTATLTMTTYSGVSETWNLMTGTATANTSTLTPTGILSSHTVSSLPDTFTLTGAISAGQWVTVETLTLSTGNIAAPVYTTFVCQ